MEINVALDELLGVRGPFTALIRNVLWFLAFNATYLGLFAFLPSTMGSLTYHTFLNTTTTISLVKQLPLIYSEDKNVTTAATLVSSLNEESEKLDTTFRLVDFTTVVLGYLTTASFFLVIKGAWALWKYVRSKRSNADDSAGTNPQMDGGLWEIHRARQRGQRDRANNRDDEIHIVGFGLDASVAVAKVGVLLFLKMFILPMILGICLDASTTTLFGHDLSDRIAFAGRDLFSFILLHWVCGITFMLLITVFLLQLREVTHPDLLARVIRPQEPQPDLLGNLMNESVATHIRRIFLSLAIYAPLLGLHIAVPVKLFTSSGLSKYVTFFNLNFWHLMKPQLQVPLELIMFHLSMLALLERYKNKIGELQHKWLIFMCKRMNLTDHVLPLSIEKFKLAGEKPILSQDDLATAHEVDIFWKELCKNKIDHQTVIKEHLVSLPNSNTEYRTPQVAPTGDRVLSNSVKYIRLPAEESLLLLPTKLGKYRFQVKGDGSKTIQIWEEVPGKPIPRPPEGWDDLGAGGAFIQGRWAWGKEQKSLVEGSVAYREPLRPSKKHRRPLYLQFKVAALILLSWMAVTFTFFGIASAPLAVGRSLYYLFRIPKSYIHDPFAFCIGGCIFFPVMSLVASSFKASTREDGLIDRLNKWTQSFRFPPLPKLLVVLEAAILWILVAPLSFGIVYETALIKPVSWFAVSPSLEMNSVIMGWFVGLFVLNVWSFFAYFRVFTKRFWSNIGNGILEPPVDENGIPRNAINNNANDEVGDGLVNGIRRWQGRNGRVARFFGIWKSVLCSWEWDTVDREILLDEFARPAAKQMASALVGSALSFHLVYALVLKFTPLEAEGASRKFSFMNESFPLLFLFQSSCCFSIVFSLSMQCRLLVW